MIHNRIKVLVVDDSAFARKVLRDIVNRAPDMEVVGSASDGLDALEKVAHLKPDVMTLDLTMPNLDGLGLLRMLPRGGSPRVIIISKSDGQSEQVLTALEAGAVDVVQKPTALATDQLYELGDEVITKIRVAAGASARPAPIIPTRARVAGKSSDVKLIVVGASTGGPQALSRLISSLPADFPVPVAIVLHIPVGYTAALAARLDAVSELEVREATEGMSFDVGTVTLARAGMHMRVHPMGDRLVARLSMEPYETPHRPAVDVLFSTAAEAAGAAVIGVVLTGMGDDGLAGAKKLRAAGARILSESESSCVVYGMPRVVFEAGISLEQPTIEQMGNALVRLV